LGVRVIETSGSPYARLVPVGIESVRILDSFWGPRLERLIDVTLPTVIDCWRTLERWITLGLLLGRSLGVL